MSKKKNKVRFGLKNCYYAKATFDEDGNATYGKPVRFSVPEEGPLSHADEYMPDFMKLMAEGIKKNAKVVMAAVRGLSDSMSGVFTGLSIPEINASQLALAGAGGGSVSNSKTINMGGLTVNVNGYNVQNDDDLADKVADRINAMLNEDDSVWGR